MLKVDLHLHTKEDPEDIIKYSAKELIDIASEDNFDALAITPHNALMSTTLGKKKTQEIFNYAKKKGILLIMGVEFSIEGKEVLIYNITEQEIRKIKTLNDLRNIKQSNNKIFVIAPHPFFLTRDCLGNKLEKNIDLFDAIEHSWFYTKLINRNIPATKIADKYSKPLVATSDCHNLKEFNTSFCLVECKKSADAIFESIKRHKYANSTKPLHFAFFFLKTILLIFGIYHRILCRMLKISTVKIRI